MVIKQISHSRQFFMLDKFDPISKSLTKKLSGPPSEAREARWAAEVLEVMNQAGPGPLKRLVGRIE